MPINFNTLVTSEIELRKLFLDFFKHVINMQQHLIKVIKANKKMTSKEWNKFLKFEKVCNAFEAKLLDETSWVISKDMPRAAHLRYLIAIIRSAKDLERMGDFAFNVAKYFHGYKVDSKIANVLVKIANESLSVVKTFYNNLIDRKAQTSEYYTNQATPLIIDFGKNYRKHFKRLGEIIFEGNMRVTDNVIGGFTAAKNLERNTDHAFNIIENFTYIREGNFHFTNESRKGY